MSSYIHGRLDPREAARLEKQARFAAGFILRDFEAAAGMRVLDLGCGVGAMAATILARFSGVRLSAVELQSGPLAHARVHHPGPAFVQGNAARLPLRDGVYDRIHASWLLEHLSDPRPLLAETRRVLRTGGYCHFTEVDNSTLRSHPERPEVMEAMRALNAAQVAGGGDPFIGARLGVLFEEAGFSRVEVVPATLHGSGADPALFRDLAEEFAEIFESLDEALGETMGPRIAAAASLDFSASLRRPPGKNGLLESKRGAWGNWEVPSQSRPRERFPSPSRTQGRFDRKRIEHTLRIKAPRGRRGWRKDPLGGQGGRKIQAGALRGLPKTPGAWMDYRCAVAQAWK